MRTLLFVYNADTGLFNTITDTAHKIFSPSTYSCNLCKLTFGLKNMKDDWKDFIESLPVTLEFLHRDEFHDRFPEHKAVALPAIFEKTAKDLKLAVPASELDKAKSIDDLKALVNKVIE